MDIGHLTVLSTGSLWAQTGGGSRGSVLSGGHGQQSGKSEKIELHDTGS